MTSLRVGATGGARIAPALLAMLLAGAGHSADPVAGRAVVVGGERASITPCFRCHGLDGAGDASGAFPRLSGQMPFYLYKQLLDYAAGTRPNEIMTPIARQLTERQMADVAAYYAGVAAPPRQAPEAAREVLERGHRIAHEGLPGEKLQPCVICHDKQGSGLPPLIPYLAGQYAPYTELQLRLWRLGMRRNDAMGVMADIAARMSEADMRALAIYFETLPPPATLSAEPRADEGADARAR